MLYVALDPYGVHVLFVISHCSIVNFVSYCTQHITQLFFSIEYTCTYACTYALYMTSHVTQLLIDYV